jgi:putative acetyltransferase
MSVRPPSVDEAEVLRDLHDESVRGLCQAEYSAEQLGAWATPKPVEDYVRDIRQHVFLVAELEGSVVGFGALSAEDSEVLAVFVRPHCARQGVGSALLDALEHAARARGIGELVVSSSLTAEQFYRARGYTGAERCVHRTRDQSLPCVRMRKHL